MPFEEHPSLFTPPDETVLWRYMDFARFVQLLESHSLWFARTDQFEDPFEGTFTDAEIEFFKSNSPPPGTPSEMSMLAAFTGSTRMMRATTYLNCWRGGTEESLAMWDLYGRGSGIVAVKTTVGRLKDELTKSAFPSFIGKVQYIDWSTAPWHNNSIAMCARKDSSYQHEAEVRAIVWEFRNFNLFQDIFGTLKNWTDRKRTDPPLGITVPVDLSHLITEVVVGPREKPWVGELVGQVLGRYGFTFSYTISDRLSSRLDHE